MQRCAFLLFCSVLSLQAQVEQLATSGDGRTLLFHSYFRLQTEPDVGAQGKIYRWQDGEWTRLAAAPEANPTGVSPPDVNNPFLSSDGRVVGWQINVGCFLCQIIVAPLFSSEISGMKMPVGFPLGTIRMSANGRYFTADKFPFSGIRYLDAETGAVAEIPVDLYARPPVREVSNDGTALLLITPPKHPEQNSSPGVLSLWKPGSGPRAIYSENRVFSPTISAEGGRVAFEAVVEGGQNDDQRTLIVLDTQTGERITIASMPSKDYRALRDSFSKPVWDASGTRLVYPTYNDKPSASAGSNHRREG
jgi:hypothetical protein